MRGTRIPQNLNGQDRIALGLSAGGLAVLLLGLLAAYTIVHLDIPLAVRILAASITAALTAALAWLRLYLRLSRQRPLLHLFSYCQPGRAALIHARDFFLVRRKIRQRGDVARRAI